VAVKKKTAPVRKASKKQGSAAKTNPKKTSAAMAKNRKAAAGKAGTQKLKYEVLVPTSQTKRVLAVPAVTVNFPTAGQIVPSTFMANGTVSGAVSLLTVFITGPSGRIDGNPLHPTPSAGNWMSQFGSPTPVPSGDYVLTVQATLGGGTTSVQVFFTVQ